MTSKKKMKEETVMKRSGFSVGLCVMGLLVGPAVAQAAPAETPELVEKGKQAFTNNCAPCHGATGKGDGAAAAALNPKPRDLTLGEYKQGGKLDELFKTITTGLPNTAMAPFGVLPEGDRWAIVAYVKSLNANPQSSRKARKGKKK
jgi:mono/diheme cytochrome c family protein